MDPNTNENGEKSPENNQNSEGVSNTTSHDAIPTETNQDTIGNVNNNSEIGNSKSALIEKESGFSQVVVQLALPSPREMLVDSLSSSESRDSAAMDSADRTGHSTSAGDIEDTTLDRLREQLRVTQEELMSKNEKLRRLTSLQMNTDTEIHELTENLFQEAYKMVEKEKIQRSHADKLLREATMKIDVLQSEVEALKNLVSIAHSSRDKSPKSGHFTPTSTTKREPSPQRRFTSPKTWFEGSSKDTATARLPPKLPTPLTWNQRRNNSEYSLKALSVLDAEEERDEERMAIQKQLSFREVDPIYFTEFTRWREKQNLDEKDHGFMKRVYDEEIHPCLNFANQNLSDDILKAIEDNSIVLEAVNEGHPHVTTCHLSEVPRLCPYRLKTTNEAQWMKISHLCRNRIAAVCDFFTYLRYLKGGLIKCGLHDAYWDVIRLRKNMSLTRLGLGFIPAELRKDSS